MGSNAREQSRPPLNRAALTGMAAGNPAAPTILDALEQREGPAASEAMRMHILTSFQFTLDHLKRSRGGDDAPSKHQAAHDQASSRKQGRGLWHWRRIESSVHLKLTKGGSTVLVA